MAKHSLFLMGRKTDGPPSYGSRDEPYKRSRYAGMLFLQEKRIRCIILVLNKVGFSDFFFKFCIRNPIRNLNKEMSLLQFPLLLTD